MALIGDIKPAESLGRGVFSRKDRGRADRVGVRVNVFLEKSGVTDISVDRLDLAPIEEFVSIGERRATVRNRNFYGWAVVEAQRVDANGREVAAAPLLDNPYHANIGLPESAAQDPDVQFRHAHELADMATWRARPQ